MKWSEMGSLTGTIAVLGSFVFGLLLALLVAGLRKFGFLPRRGALAVALVVVVGVGGTVACGVLADLFTIETANWLLLLFLASGVPMLAEAGIATYQHGVKKELKDG